MNKQIYRIPKDSVLAGVCTGFALYFNVAPNIVRLIYVIACLINPAFLLVYPLAWALMEEEPHKDYTI